jgi:hypothetical protein
MLVVLSLVPLVLTWVCEAQSETPSRPSERVWSARSGRVHGICRPASQGRVWVYPQPNGNLPGGSKGPGAAHRNVPLDWRDTLFPCARPGRERLPKHDHYEEPGGPEVNRIPCLHSMCALLHTASLHFLTVAPPGQPTGADCAGPRGWSSRCGKPAASSRQDHPPALPVRCRTVVRSPGRLPWLPAPPPR